MDRSITPQQIDDVLSDVVMLRHRLASLTEAEFIHTSTVRADTVKYNGQLKTLMACHTTVRQAASIADEMAAAVSISPNIDTHSQFTIATIIDEICKSMTCSGISAKTLETFTYAISDQLCCHPLCCLARAIVV